MLRGIDHLVIAVRDVDGTAAAVERELGLAFTGGGRHERMGTWNRLAFLGDTYVELIGVFDRDLVLSSTDFAVGRAALARLEADGDGLASYAVATDDIRGDVARLRDAGSPIGDPVAGSRRRPDGEEVRWITAFPSLGPAEPPFLIEHEPSGAEWGEEARRSRAAFLHPDGGAVRLTELVLPVPDPASVAEQYGRTLGIAFSEGWHAGLDGQVITLRPRLGEGRGAAADRPLLRLAGDPGTPVAEAMVGGVRWVRGPRQADA